MQDYNSAITRKDKVLDQPIEQSNEIKNLNHLQEITHCKTNVGQLFLNNKQSGKNTDHHFHLNLI